jgi:hypothetical protein
MSLRIAILGWLVLLGGRLGAAAEAPRTLLVEIRHVPEALRAAKGVTAGPGRFSFDSYKRDQVLSVVRDTVLTLATPEEFAAMRQEGLEASVVMESADRLTLVKRGIYGPTLRPNPIYHTYDQIVRRAEELAREHPRLLARMQIGETTQFKRPIFAYRLSDDAARPQERPAVLFDGCHHSDEVMGAEIILALMEKLVAGYGRDPEVTAWLGTLEIWLVPVVNVDGHNIVTSGRDPRWRKNARDVNGDGVTGVYPEGVDVNRGYDFNWALGGTGNPADANYRGEFPFSEAENRAMRRLADERQFLLSVSYHSQGEVIYYPWSWNGTPAPDDAVIKPIAAEVAAHIRRMDGTGTYAFSPGGPGSQSYPWLYGRRGTLDFIIETGKGTHLFPPEEVPGIIAANLEGVRALLKHAGGPGLAVRVTEAATGRPLAAQVWLPQIENETVDRRGSEARFGRRWRLLTPGRHNVIVSREGYRTVALPEVGVRAEGWTPLEVRLEPEKR